MAAERDVARDRNLAIVRDFIAEGQQSGRSLQDVIAALRLRRKRVLHDEIFIELRLSARILDLGNF